jgi:predicted DNA-binding helix-hairpin-helix protein
MNIHKVPDALEKMNLIASSTYFEPAGDMPGIERDKHKYQSRSLTECISNVSTPKGKKAMVKTMVTTACERNCNYCPFRAGRSRTRRVTIKPDEMAEAFDKIARARLAEGLFLSSGIIKGGVSTQDKILDTIEIVRKKYQYRGFIHLKIMPGAEYEQVKRAIELADRVSLNLEGATAERLTALAPKKEFNTELLLRLKWAHEIRLKLPPHIKKPSIVSQFVVGAVGDTDVELLSLSNKLYDQIKLSRVYYSAFGPVIQTPFENVPAVDSQREFRLYQASFLLRDYKWDVEDLNFTPSGNLDLAVDPKKAWAEANLRHAPIDVMHATREQLMRIPSVGPKTADDIIAARKRGRLDDISYLHKLGVNTKDASPYILMNGHLPPQQLRLF